jgi:predicted ATP-dependent serine protease
MILYSHRTPPKPETSGNGTTTPEEEASGATGSRAEILNIFNTATCSAEKLATIDVPPRKAIQGEWCKEGDLGFIFGQRGFGKTWLAMFYARRWAEAGKRVLYVDGEMALDDIRQRDAALANAPAEGMFYLHHEVLFHKTGTVLNLTDPAAQEALLEKCERDGIEILVLDNLSCLFTGMKENDANAWEQVLPWLLELRRKRIAVVFVAHAGRNGQMRGTSRREDAAFWIIELTEVRSPGEVQTGARFVTRFVKNRNATEKECPPMEWQFDLPKGESHATVTSKPLSIMADFRQCIEVGLTGATDIAEELGISKGQVSKLARQGIKAGWLRKVGREYALTGNL